MRLRCSDNQKKGFWLFCCWCVGSRPEKETTFALSNRKDINQMAETFCHHAETGLLNRGGQPVTIRPFFPIAQSNHTMSVLIISVKVAFTSFKVKLPTSSLFSLFCLPCYVTTSLTLSPRLLKANWSKSHQALHGVWCVCAELTIFCFIVTNTLLQDSYCKHPFWRSKSNQKDLSIPIRPAWREITAPEVNYWGKEEWNQKVLVSLVSSCKKRKATIYNC